MTKFQISKFVERLNKTGTKGREAIINLLSILGIAFGVIALIVILSVMNGFQGVYIKNIMEVSSGHIRLTGSLRKLGKSKNKSSKQKFFLFRRSQSNNGRFV